MTLDESQERSEGSDARWIHTVVGNWRSIFTACGGFIPRVSKNHR